MVTPVRRNPLREFCGGVADFGRGMRIWAVSPRLMLLGALPALVVGLVLGALLVWLVLRLPSVAATLTPFADGWWPGLRDAIRTVVGAATVLLAAVVAVLAYTAVVLAVGDPCYERISARVERHLGDAPPDRHEPLVPGLLRATADGLRLLVAGAAVGLLVLLVGLVPVVGSVAAAVLGAVLGGRLLALELTGAAFDARGHRLRDRRQALATRRARTLGFGIAVYVVFLVPFAAVVAMPAAVAGATVLARGVLPSAAAASPERPDRVPIAGG